MRREIGKEEVVKAHYYEGVANHIGPEPYAGIREGVGEVLPRRDQDRNARQSG